VIGAGDDRGELFWSNRADDVDCAGWNSFGWVNRDGPPRIQNFSQRASPQRALYEWHLCFRLGGRTYRGWRGYDPGPGSRIDLECRIDARQPPPDTYVCRRTKLDVSPEGYGDAAYACREGEICRRFESESEYRAWKALPILTQEEKIAVTVALIRHEIAQSSFLGVNEMEYYVQVGDGDLPREIADSLSDRGHRFHPASEQPDRRGASMSVSNFLRRSDGTMQVDYGIYCGALCGSGSTVILKKNAAGQWQVVSAVENWVS